MKVFSNINQPRFIQSLNVLIALLISLTLLATTNPLINARGHNEELVQTPQGSFSNAQSIIVADAPPSNFPGVGSIYPSTINVTGLGTSITNLTVTITNLTHPFPPDMDVLLVGPGGQSLILQSDAGSTTSAVNRTYTFDDAAPSQLPNTGGLPNAVSVKPTNHVGNDGTNDIFPAPAPAGPYGNPGPQATGTATLASTFNGTDPNGIWQLFVTDDEHLDSGGINSGWSLNVTANTVVNVPLSRVSDFDGDNKTDLAVVRDTGGSNATWYVNGTTSGFFAQGWGIISTDVFVPQDYDGDGKTDIAVWRSTSGTWYILQSQTQTLRVVGFGTSGDDPSVVEDYDADGKADPAVVRSSGGLRTWYVLGSTSGFAYKQWGLTTDTLAPGDYDGDGKADFAVRRGNQPAAGLATFYIDRSTSGFQSIAWGNNTDTIAPGDYDADGKTDIAVAHPAGADIFWYVRLSGGGIIENVRWGVTGDLVTQGDYNGDNKTDIAVWRSSTGFFYVNLSGGGNIFAQWGQAGDYPPANSNAH